MPARRPVSLRHVPPALATLAFLALAGSCDFGLPTDIHVAAVQTAPRATTAVGAVTTLQWCWNHRSLPVYRELFSDDFQFSLAASDTVGNPYVTLPWGREEEINSAQHLFGSGCPGEPVVSTIDLVLNSDLVAQRDFRPGKTWPWHQTVWTNATLTLAMTDGSARRASGAAVYYLVRGDSAAIPQELRNQGIEPDTTRWFIERWDDETNLIAPLGRPADAAPARTLPTRMVTWGDLKALYDCPATAAAP